MAATRLDLDAPETPLRAFVENSPNAVFLKDESGRYLFMNRAARALIGDAPYQGRTDHDARSGRDIARL